MPCIFVGQLILSPLLIGKMSDGKSVARWDSDGHGVALWRQDVVVSAEQARDVRTRGVCPPVIPSVVRQFDVQHLCAVGFSGDAVFHKHDFVFLSPRSFEGYQQVEIAARAPDGFCRDGIRFHFRRLLRERRHAKDGLQTDHLRPLCFLQKDGSDAVGGVGHQRLCDGLLVSHRQRVGIVEDETGNAPVVVGGNFGQVLSVGHDGIIVLAACRQRHDPRGGQQ